MEETRIDMRLQTPEQIAEAVKAAQLCFKLGQTMPFRPNQKPIPNWSQYLSSKVCQARTLSL